MSQQKYVAFEKFDSALQRSRRSGVVAEPRCVANAQIAQSRGTPDILLVNS